MSKNTLIVTGYATVIEEKREIFLAAAATMLSCVRKDTGCLQASLLEDCSTPNKFFFYEEWEDKDCWVKHLQQPYIAAFIEQTEPCSMDRDVRKFTRCEI